MTWNSTAATSPARSRTGGGSLTCNCPTGGCNCDGSGISVTRYVTSTGSTWVISVPTYAYDNADRYPLLEDFEVALKRYPFFRLARPARAAPTEEILPPRRLPRRPALMLERVDWARLPRRSPRNI